MLVLVAVAIIAAVGSRIVLPGRVAILERGGRFSRVLNPGYHLLLPGVDKVRTWIKVNPVALHTGTPKFRTTDGMEQSLEVTVTAQVTDPKVAAYVADGYRQALLGAARQRAFEVAAQLTGQARAWGVEVQRVEISA